MADERADHRGDDDRGITRRAAIGTGIATVGLGALWASPLASASTNAPSVDQSLKRLSAGISASTVRPRIKDQLVSTLAQAREQLAGGHNVDCRQTLRQEFVRLLERYRGRDGISDRDADSWTSAAQRLADKIPNRDPPGAANGATVTVFNCYPQATDLIVVNHGAVGNIAGWSDGGANRPPKYTPASLTVPRSKEPEPKSFGIGDNRFRIDWDNNAAGTSTIRIPSPDESGIRVDEDVLLFVALNEVTIMDAFGRVAGRVTQQVSRR
jgi:hypothetical protein